ncbi:TonB-dependent receptor domain-containing protein [Methyloversatilis sp.]|uniref:TonB-dependent receptor domain-containing protein n=1 Tax=Methyloversatilis sp. TaxID=2569862 RepID=UPI003D2B7B8F
MKHRIPPRPRLLLALMWPLACAAQDGAPSEEDVVTLPEIQVRDTREDVRPPAVELTPDRPVTTIGPEAIERRQAGTIFDLLKDVPGVAVNGGPRASGMKFNLRGFSDNEDVLFKIDGAVKGFEKYRFGSGVFIEPELLKAIEIERGPSLKSGSGALGGTISATTKSAADYLRPGERFGSQIKYGYNANSSERLRMVTVYGRPNGYLDLVVSIARRDSDDIRLPDRSRLDLTAVHSESRFAKATFYASDDLTLELSQTYYTGGPERAPYDATAGSAGQFGVVERSIEDTTTNLRVNYAPADSWIALRGTLAYETTDLDDVHRITQSRICVSPSTAFPAAFRIDRCDDAWRYSIWTAEVFNDTRYAIGELQGVLSVGYQGIRNSRDISRVTSRALTNQQVYPNGFNEAQPPGDKVSDALIVENAFTLGAFTFTPGARLDRYHVSAEGQTRTNMIAAGQSPDIRFVKLSPAAALTWRIPRSDWSATVRYHEAFRPPLVDEYFARGSFASRCAKSAGWALPGNPVLYPEPLYDPSGYGQTYDPALDLAPDNEICGALYRPQESSNHELTLAWMPQPSSPRDGRWQARVTYYDIHTRHLLTSLSNIGGEVGQPGKERRKGTELEISYDGRHAFSSLSWSEIDGRITNAVAGTDYALYGVPGDTLSISAGVRGFDGRVEAGVRMRDIADRRAATSTTATVCSRPGTLVVPGVGTIGTQYGVRLYDLFASWQMTRDTQMRFNLDNLTNETYCLQDGFAGAVGIQAPGRAAKLSVTMRF